LLSAKSTGSKAGGGLGHGLLCHDGWRLSPRRTSNDQNRGVDAGLVECVRQARSGPGSAYALEYFEAAGAQWRIRSILDLVGPIILPFFKRYFR